MAEQETKTGDSGQVSTEQSTGSSGEVSKTFTQTDVDRIVQERLSRDRAKYGDYDDLRQKVSEYEKHKEQLTQQEMEKKQEYEKLKEGWTKKESDYQRILNENKAALQSERINNTLTNEIFKKNAYPETAQLIRSMAKYNDDGTISIRGKDANGMETELSVEQGVEQFLKERPYLVKGSAQGGGGTAGSSGAGGGGQVNDNLAAQLQNAMAVGDRKAVNELKLKIKAKHTGNAFVV